MDIFGKSGVYYKIEKQCPGISWYSYVLFPISPQAVKQGEKKVMAFILFHQRKETQQKVIILIGLFSYKLPNLRASDKSKQTVSERIPGE